jgi:hypothetical protein
VHEIDTGPNRKHSGNVHRSQVVRERIEDYLMRGGGNRSREHYEQRRADFINAAVRTAERLDMRRWKASGTKTVAHGAQDSLKVLFGEKGAYTNHKGEHGAFKRTGVNSGWVLDIWEATLDHQIREDPFLRAVERDDQFRESEEPDVTELDEIERLNEGGPKAFAIGHASPISMRLLDAYLNRDDETIMRIAVELEAYENGK